MIINAIFLAFRQIQRNFLRAILTMLGIIIGVGSVVVMITLGNGVTQNISQSISSLGSNILILHPTPNLTPGLPPRRFSLEEINKLKLQTSHFTRAIAPIVDSSVLAQFRQNNTQTKAQGVTSDYFVATNWDLQSGRGFDAQDYRSGSNVCIIGKSIQDNLFGETQNPLGMQIRLGNIICECIGILESKGQGAMGNDQDDVILLPLKTFQRSILKSTTLYNISRVIISLQDNVDSSVATQNITDIFAQILNLKDSRIDFNIRDTKQILQTMESATGTLTLFLGAIAGVSLIVGGIGVMNIMLVSITERTKEIGTRLAIGALQSEVLLQFLIEAVTLSSLGGIIGIVLSFFISMIVCALMELPFVFDYSIAIIAFIFSGFIGVLFGYLPAKRASKLNPIEALRHE
ncbi:MAG: ABC transporter permease [Helicobacter sp.]|nr:ABC transporter permease [Helicobacter sp.]